MSRIIVIGGGTCGLATGMMLAADGHDVIQLERDGGDVPDTVEQAWEHWERKGIPQFRQPHNLFPKFRLLLDENLPQINEALAAGGAARFDFLDNMPPSIADHTPRDGDDRFWFFTGRRVFLEWVFTRAAQATKGLDIRYNTRVASLVTGASAIDGVPHVTGVRTTDGEEIETDFVVDATGRGSKLPDWIEAVGGRRPYEESEDRGFTYYTRYFQGPQLPVFMGPLVSEFATMSLLTMHGDNNTWSVTIFTASGDQPLKTLRNNDTFMRVLAACPMQAHWADGESISDVLPMSGIMDKYRRFVVDDAPVATGIAAVADAWSCTNPSAGRGLSIGLIHAVALRDTIREHLGDPVALARTFDDVTETELKPWYTAQVEADRTRLAEMDARREGREPPPIAYPEFQKRIDIFRAVGFDADLFREAMACIGCITRPDVFINTPGLLEKAKALTADVPADGGGWPGPTRSELLELVAT